MDPLRHIKPAVRDIRAYSLAAREAPVKINQNENPWDLPESVKRKVLEKALVRPWSRYPDFDPRELTAALAAFAGWKEDGVLAGNGSNELIEALLLVTVASGTKVVIPEPTFTLYALLTGILGGEAVRVPLTEDLGYDVGALVQARRESEAAVTIVCSPNNPTGTGLTRADIGRLCRAGDGLVVVDEAYHEFSGETAVPLLEEHPNLLIFRTFSKAMALAGLRVGYLMTSPEIAREVNKARLPYNLNFFTQSAALAALEEGEVLGDMVRRLIDERERILEVLADVPGVRAWPSQANFFLLEILEGSPKGVFEGLYRRGVLVRDVTSYPMLSRHLRISVGTPEENEAFLHALGAALGEAGASVSADMGRA
jgi:histidinol-phosphate aminotransferase